MVITLAMRMGEGVRAQAETTGSLRWWDTVLESLSGLPKPKLSRGPPEAVHPQRPHRALFWPKQHASSVKHTPDELKGPDPVLTIYVILTGSLHVSEFFFFPTVIYR